MSGKDVDMVNPFGDGPKLTGTDIDRNIASKKHGSGSGMNDEDPSSVNPFGHGRRKTATQIDADIAAKKMALGGGKDKDGMGPPLPKVLAEHGRKKTVDDMAKVVSRWLTSQMEQIIAMAKSEKLTHGHDAETPSYVSESKQGQRGTASEIDEHREKGRRTRFVMKTLEIRDWIYGLLKKDISAESKAKSASNQAAEFISALEDGILLCKLIKAISPSESIHLEENPKANPFYKRDNVSNFLTVATKLGVAPQSMFVTDDLVSRKNDEMVISALMFLARAAMKHGVAPPLVIQYELDIDEENHEDENNGVPIVMVEEAMADETDAEKSKREQLEKLSIQIKELEVDIEKEEADGGGDDESDTSSQASSPPPSGKTISSPPDSDVVMSNSPESTQQQQPSAAAAPAPTTTAPAISPSRLNAFAAPFVPAAKPHPPQPARIYAGTHAVSEAEQKQRDKKQKDKAKSRAKREKAKAKYAALQEAQLLEKSLRHGGEKYKAIKGDFIDEAVQRAVNDAENKFYSVIRIRRAKKLGKVSTAKRSRREKEGGGIYRVGTAHKVHVRLMQEMLFVRQNNQWVDFVVFVHDQIEADKRAHDRVHSEEGPKMVWVPKGSQSPPPAST